MDIYKWTSHTCTLSALNIWSSHVVPLISLFAMSLNALFTSVYSPTQCSQYWSGLALVIAHIKNFDVALLKMFKKFMHSLLTPPVFSFLQIDSLRQTCSRYTSPGNVKYVSRRYPSLFSGFLTLNLLTQTSDLPKTSDLTQNSRKNCKILYIFIVLFDFADFHDLWANKQSQHWSRSVKRINTRLFYICIDTNSIAIKITIGFTPKK